MDYSPKGSGLSMLSFVSRFSVVCVFAVVSLSICADTESDIEIYGQLPQFRAFSIAPNGEHIAFIHRGDEGDRVLIFNTKENKVVGGARVGDMKAFSTYFLTDEHVVIRASTTSYAIGYRNKWEHSGAIVYNLKTRKSKLLLQRTKDLHPAQTGLGRVVGFNPEKQLVYMPAFERGSNPRRNLYSVRLKTGIGKLFAKGTTHTRFWFVSTDGTVLARDEYREKEKLHVIQSKISGKWQEIYRHKTDIPSIRVRGVGGDGESLLFFDSSNDRRALYEMSLHNGSIVGPRYSRDDADIDRLMLDINQKLTAVVYGGFKPSYEFVDPELSRLFSRLEANFPNSSVYPSDWTPDLAMFIVKVAGGDAAGSFYLMNAEPPELTAKFPAEYEVDAIGQIKTMRYTARDGLKIPALLTLPTGDQPKKNLPLIVMPHGGPETYDQLGFDWMAQYLAQKGYAVLQPNFRGSKGFGYDFRRAGRGKWGREMQDDVSDGVTAVVEAGYADADRVCIVGSSYGGYSALIGGAFTPELYRCIVSIGGISDLPYMLSKVKLKYGRYHWVISYWHKLIGDSKTERDKLESISPANFADQFQAPVLLIHGDDDTIVHIRQSRIMHKALKEAGKSVEFKELDGGDHWLDTSSARLQTLRAIDKFLDTHNPARLPTASQ